MLPAELLSYWRAITVRDREIVEAVVRPEHRGPSPALRDALAAWPGIHYWASGGDAGRLALIRATAPPRRERWPLLALLFVLTFGTAMLGGALLQGAEIHTLPSLLGGWRAFDDHLRAWARTIGAGLPFAMAIMAILLSHEMGHYLFAKRYLIDASPPYFLPAPVELSFIGTFGAFIRLRSPIVDRRQLLDVGAAGPWVGFGVALIMLIVGMQQAETLRGDFGAEMVVQVGGAYLAVGDSLLTEFVRRTFVGEGTIVLGPLAAAGWTGMLVTSLNLLPLGQLDGGHIVYALVGKWQRALGLVTWAGLIWLGQDFWPWWIWAALTLALGGGRLAHPRVLEDRRPLPRSRVPIGWASVALFVVTFAPVPIHL